MSNKVKAILGILAFVVLIGGAYLAYNSLSEKYKPKTNLQLQSSDNSSGSQSGVSGNTNESSAASGTQASESAGQSQSTPAEKSQKMKAPDFTVYDKDGKEVRLSSLFGKPIVLNFWASWCPPCKGEMPHFNKVYADVKKDVIFMMVDMVDGQRETADKGKKYVEDQGFTFPVYFDTDQEAATVYGIASIPTTIFIDKDGYIVTGAQGAIDEETLLKGIGYIK